MASTESARSTPSEDVVYLILRRMRSPLIVLVVIFSFCTVGLSLVPGIDAAGNPAPSMSIFEAFYVISYTATTIGFGEIPNPYSTQQRMWMTLSIYASVIGWSYSLVNLLGLVQERSFQNAVRISRFSRRIYHLREPFYIVCGAGETGSLVCHGLDRLGLRFVMIEQDADRLASVRLDEFTADAPMITADSSQPGVLRQAGLLSPHCRGVMALTADDETNRAIAVTTRLLAPRVPVLARIRDTEAETHIGAFGGDLVINPFERFAEHLGSAVSAPQRFWLREILTGLEGDPLPDRHCPPRGHWIMCGWGRFGHAVTEELRRYRGNTVSVVDVANYAVGEVDVKGTGTDSESLRAAGIDRAVGIVAGNRTDTKNLAIAVAARDLKPDIFIVTRQNQNANTPLFDAFTDDLAMVPSRIVAREFLARITTPLLVRFLNRLPFFREDECARLAEELAAINHGLVPAIWSVPVNSARAPGVMSLIEDGVDVTVGALVRAPHDRSIRQRVVVLLVVRRHQVIELPGDDFVLAPGDEVLVAGSPRSQRRMSFCTGNADLMGYLATGQESGGGTVWRWLAERRKARAGAKEVTPPAASA